MFYSCAEFTAPNGRLNRAFSGEDCVPSIDITTADSQIEMDTTNYMHVSTNDKRDIDSMRHNDSSSSGSEQACSKLHNVKVFLIIMCSFSVTQG